MYKQIKIRNWRQFDQIDIKFHDHLTVLTGANGAGKTTLLNLLAETIGWESEFVSSYCKDSKGISHYLGSLWEKIRSTWAGNLWQKNKIGELYLSDDKVISYKIPDNITSGTYKIICEGEHTERGVYINSHRPNFPYKSIKSLPTTILSRKQIFDKFNNFNKIYIKDKYRNSELIGSWSKFW